MSKIHDYRSRYWGHDYVWTPRKEGQEGTLMGWGKGIEKGDYIIFGEAQGARYKVIKICYYRDPSDMFSAELKFFPRTAEQARRYDVMFAKENKTSLCNN